MGDRDLTTVMRRGAGVARWLKRFRWLPLVAVGAIGSLMLPTPGAAQGAPLSEGLVCTTNKTSSFVLTASPGYINTPDGNSVFMWSYANGNSSFQYPGPVLCVNEGDRVTITLKNTLPVATSLVFPGLTEVKADNRFVQFDAGTGSLSKPAQPGGTVTYTFDAANPGTFLYQSGTNPELQVLMGLVGAIIVRPTKITWPVPANAAYVYDDASTVYDQNREFIHLLTEIDPHMHHAIELETCFQKDADPNCKQPNPLTYDMTRYQPRYWMINGRSFPDDITPNNSPALPNQPYGALVHVMPKEAQPLPALVRFLNAGPVNYPFHPHSNHDQAIGIDGRVLINKASALAGQPANTSFDRFGFVVAPGQTSDALFSWTDAQKWNPDTKPIEVTQPAAQNRTDGPYWSGSPYLGVKLPLLNGITQWNQCGEYYHFAHSHALFQVTNYGASGGGMLTLIRVDPPPEVQKKYGQNCMGGPGYPQP